PERNIHRKSIPQCKLDITCTKRYTRDDTHDRSQEVNTDRRMERKMRSTYEKTAP
ncbi:Hypothetical predicted protein, partial [Pelobates cultripes]